MEVLRLLKKIRLQQVRQSLSKPIAHTLRRLFEAWEERDVRIPDLVQKE